MNGEYADRELDLFIAQKIMKAPGAPAYSADITHAWQVVEKMMRQYHCEAKLDNFLGVSGSLWVASFYSPVRCRRYEARGKTPSLAICRAAREAYLDLAGD